MSIYDVLQSTGLPCAYSHFKTKQDPPYIVYLGNGQDTFESDNTHYWTNNRYQVEYYFTEKNELNEAAIEGALLQAGYLYEKSEDVYNKEDNVWMIYYTV